MKLIMVAALVAAPLPLATVPADAAGLSRGEAETEQRRVEERIERNLDGRPGPALAGAASPASLHSAAAQENEEKPRKKRKSTGDKVLTGAAVILGVGALAVGGLLVAFFVS